MNILIINNNLFIYQLSNLIKFNSALIRINATEINNEISIHDIIVDNLTKREFAPKDTFLIELLNSQVLIIININ